MEDSNEVKDMQSLCENCMWCTHCHLNKKLDCEYFVDQDDDYNKECLAVRRFKSKNSRFNAYYSTYDYDYDGIGQDAYDSCIDNFVNGKTSVYKF